jgi:hypothetical protein
LVFFAALSAEPETMAELLAAVRRYLPNHQLADEGQRVADWGEVVEFEQPWCLIDLVGRTAIVGNDFCLPDPNGAYKADEDESPDGFPIVWLNTPNDWQFLEASETWRQTVSDRAEAATEQLRRDWRAVLFGRPLLEYLATGLLAAAAERKGRGETDTLEAIRPIHAQWLMTARDDLGGQSPRQVLLAHRDRIDLDVQHRASQWSRQGHAPPGLDVDSAAYRFAGFGTAEVVLYFEMIRAMLSQTWERVQDGPRASKELLIQWLAECQDHWLDTPEEDYGCELTPRQQIDSERRRMPVTGSPSHLDCDCPICQAEAEASFGPTFLCIDGHHLELEDEFAFSMTESREEWERDQVGLKLMAEAWDRREAEHESSGQKDSRDDSPSSVWHSSMVEWDQALSPEAPRELASMGIGFLLAEMVADLKPRSGGQTHIDALNKAYKSFRNAGSPVVAQFAATKLGQQLEQVAEEFPELTGKSADLQSRVDEVTRFLCLAQPDG